MKAEVFEKAAEAHQDAPGASAAKEAAAGHDHSDHEHAAKASEPKDGLERNAYTAAANVLTAIGFALLLVGFFATRGGTIGKNVSWQEGLMWGLIGFVVFNRAKIAATLDGRDLHLHDLRGTAATKFYTAGLSIRVIAEILAWSEEQVERIIRRYVARGAATKAAIRQLNEARKGT